MKTRLVIAILVALVVPVTYVAMQVLASIDDAGIVYQLRTVREPWIAQTDYAILVALPPKDRASDDPDGQGCIYEKTVTVDGRTNESIKTGPGLNQTIRMVFIRDWLLGSPGLNMIERLDTPDGTFVRMSSALIPLAFPFGCIPLVLILYPKYRALLRRRNSQCADCGYCLMANTSGICPECGKAICSRTVIHQVKPT